MNYSEKQVALSISFAGAQTSRGSYEYCKVKTVKGEQEGLITEKRPKFARVTKQMTLKEQFIQSALESPPTSMKLKPEVWKSFSEDKRIGIHVRDLVVSLYPGRVGYTYQII